MEQDLTEIHAFTWPIQKHTWFPSTNISNTGSICKLAPIPAYLIYDCIHQDIEAPILLECLTQTINIHPLPALIHEQYYILNT